MNEERIKALYREHARRQERLLDDQAAEDIQAVLTRYGWSETEAGPLDRVAASATASDIARVVAELSCESEALALALRQAHAPQTGRVRLRLYARGGFALAAGVAASALLFTLLPRPVGTPGVVDPALHQADVISSISFESEQVARTNAHAASSDEAIFKGNFDS